MTPAPPETTAEILHRVRQQLILAQVRIMELEDVRDGFTGKLADTEQLLVAAQVLADKKVEEAGHLATVRDELQAQFEHLRHMQHVTNEALNQTRLELESTALDRTRLLQETATLGDQLAQRQATITDRDATLAQLDTTIAQRTATISRLTEEYTGSQAAAASRLERINQLTGELQAIRATRSWRWTGWLRSIGRALGRRKS